MTTHANDDTTMRATPLAAAAAPRAKRKGGGLSAAASGVAPTPEVSVTARSDEPRGARDDAAVVEALWAARRSRDRAYAARRVQQQVLGRDVRAGRCGRAMGGDVSCDSYGGKRLIGGGYESCGWLGCAVCGRSIRARRAVEIMVSSKRWQERGGGLLMLTLSPPHHAGDTMEDTWERLRAVWEQCQTSRTLGREWRRRWGIAHQWVSWECTVGGAQGDHPHVHVLVMVRGPVDPETVADDLLARLWRWALSERPGHEARMAVMDGWSAAGAQAVEAGPAAATYLSKLAEGLSEDELGELRGLGLELTDTGATKQGRSGQSVPTTAVCAVIAERAEQGGMRARYWLGHDRWAAELAAGLRTWRRLTHGRPLLYASRKLRAELLADFDALSDEECAREGVVWWDRQALARLETEAAAANAGQEDPGPAPFPEQDSSPADEFTTPFAVDRATFEQWVDRDELGDAWGGPEAALCRLLDRAGVWRAAVVLHSAAYGRAQVWVSERNGRVRVGGPPGSDGWTHVPIGEVHDRCGWPAAA